MRILFSRKTAIGGPAIFIDRDGVINCRRPDDYVLEWSQFALMPGISEALRALSALHLPMIIISNQSAVSRGLLKPSTLHRITSQLHQTLLNHAVFLTAAYYCTHTPEQHCICRKPKPALLYRAANDFEIDLSRSVFIGDSDSDVKAAQAAGCWPVLFGSGLTSCSESLDWMQGLPVARAATELFEVTRNRLRVAHLAALSPSTQISAAA